MKGLEHKLSAKQVIVRVPTLCPVLKFPIRNYVLEVSMPTGLNDKIRNSFNESEPA